MDGNFLTLTLNGIKKNIIPGIILQIFAVLIVLAYYFFSPIQSFFSTVSQIKENTGFVFSSLSTILFAGIIPFIYLIFTSNFDKKKLFKIFIFMIIFWGYKGIEVDILYRLQAFIFGNDIKVLTIVKKTLADQFIYNPLWGAPTITLCYLWKDCDFSFTKLKKHINKKFFTYKIPSLLISTWIVWIPAVSVIYCFPQNLQIPIFNLVVCFWSLFLNVFGSERDKNNVEMDSVKYSKKL